MKQPLRDVILVILQEASKAAPHGTPLSFVFSQTQSGTQKVLRVRLPIREDDPFVGLINVFFREIIRDHGLEGTAPEFSLEGITTVLHELGFTRLEDLSTQHFDVWEGPLQKE